MKTFKRIILWMMISLVIQFAGLFYANNYFLASQTSIKTKKIVKSEPKKPDVEIKIPDDAKNINLSFDARYVAYYNGDILKVVNTKTGEEKKVEFREGVEVPAYKWLSDKNRMLIAEKEDSNRSSNIKLAYYDVDKDVKEDIKEIDWANKKSEVEIQPSSLINIIYIKVTTGKKSSIYWMNIMKETKKVETQCNVIGTMVVLPHEDKLLYENPVYNKVYITGKSEPIYINGVEKTTLVGVDDSDKIYIGDNQEGKVTKLYYGNVSESTNNYQIIDLKAAVDKKDIFISTAGKVYVNDSLRGVIKEIGSGKEFIYKGNFIQMYEGGIASISDGKLVKTLLN